MVLRECGKADVKKHHRIHGVGIGHGCSTALVDGIANRCNGHSIYVLNDDRMKHKVMQLARLTTEAKLLLKKVNFLNLPDKAVLRGLAVENNEGVMISEDTRLFYKLKLSKKQLKKNIGKPFQIEFTFGILDTEFSFLREFSMPKPVEGHCKYFYC